MKEIPDLPITTGGLSYSIGLIEANVTSIPALLKMSIIATVSISSHPSATGTKTDLFIILLLLLEHTHLFKLIYKQIIILFKCK